MEAIRLPETERERLQRINELIAEHGPLWLEEYEPGSFGCHELLDRASLMASLAETQLLSHPACIQDPEWFALADRAVAILGELYQRIGEKHLSGRQGAAEQP
jgi:hypothetical protein